MKKSIIMKHVISDNSKSTITNTSHINIQPNAIDLCINEVFTLSGQFTLSEQSKTHRKYQKLSTDEDNYWDLLPGDYDFLTSHYINIADGEAGWLIARSTLNRNGVFITSGLYDAGFNGLIGGTLHVGCGPFRVQRGTRIGQFLLFEAETIHLYDGSYGIDKENGRK